MYIDEANVMHTSLLFPLVFQIDATLLLSIYLSKEGPATAFTG